MSDVAWGIIGTLAGTIMGILATILVEHFRRKAAKMELKITTLGAISSNFLRQYRLIRNVIEMSIEIENASTNASLISSHQMINYKTEVERQSDLQFYTNDREKFIGYIKESNDSLIMCDSELKELRIRYLILFPKDDKTPEIIQEVIDYEILPEGDKPSRKEFEEAILNKKVHPSEWTPRLYAKHKERFKPIMDRLQTQIDIRTRELA